MPRPAVLYNRRKWQLIGKSQWCCSANCGHPLHALTYNWTRGMQLANTPPLQSTTPGLHPVSIHQTSPLVRGSKHPITAYYSIYRPRKDERLSRPGWLVTYRNKVPPPGVEPGHVTHPSTNRARRRVTSLIRPTPLPLRHAANQTYIGAWVQCARHGRMCLSNARNGSMHWPSRGVIRQDGDAASCQIILWTLVTIHINIAVAYTMINVKTDR